MIDTLPQLAALSQSWLAPLKQEDPELYEELAADIVILPAPGPVATGLPAGVDAALSQVDLCGKQIYVPFYPRLRRRSGGTHRGL